MWKLFKYVAIPNKIMSTNMKARGFRDFLPKDEILRRKIIGIIEKNYEKYGFDPMSEPSIEKLEILEAKSGEGIKTEIFRIEESDLGLRFDLTVSLARMYSENLDLPLPFKRYTTGLAWRREEPQFGRYREFIQCDADILGSASMRCEAELLACACSILKDLGVNDYRILVNNRKILTGFFKSMNIEDDKIESVIRIVDKLDKKSEKEVIDELKQNGFTNGKEILNGLNVNLDEFEKNEFCVEGATELRELFHLLESYGITNVQFVPTIARGLGYYTGPIYEIKSSNPKLGTICAGGRFDTMLELYSGKSVPAVGISFGVDRLTILFDNENDKTKTQIVLVNVKDENYNKLLEISQELRNMGFNVRTDLMTRNMRKQIEYSSSLGAKYIGILGDNEIENKEISIKNLETGEQKTMKIKELELF
jgi:histidyl-tRNA synthetase